jgi:hypothetical protein
LKRKNKAPTGPKEPKADKLEFDGVVQEEDEGPTVGQEDLRQVQGGPPQGRRAHHLREPRHKQRQG